MEDGFAEVCVRLLIPRNVFQAFRLVALARGRSAEDIITDFVADGFDALDIKLTGLLKPDTPVTSRMIKDLLSANAKVAAEYTGGSGPSFTVKTVQI